MKPSGRPGLAPEGFMLYERGISDDVAGHLMAGAFFL